VTLPADIVVFDHLDQILALVQVRAARNTSAGWACRIREGVLDTQPGLIPPPYFLVVARDWLYIWTSRDRDCPPDEQYRTEQVFARYFTEANTSADKIAPSAFELMVGIWLTDMASGSARAGAPWLGLSGLPDAVTAGRIEFLNAA
jgi:hypothetical protein